MGAWIWRLVTIFWLALYSVIHVPLLVLLVALLGVWLATFVGIIIIGAWSTVFYFLLYRNPGLTKFKGNPVQLRWVNQALAWLRSLRSKPSLVVLSFVLLGAWGGVVLLRLTYPDDHLLRAFPWVWLGSAANAFVLVVVVYGPPAVLARELIVVLFGG